MIRGTVTELYSTAAAGDLPILYGGSVNAENCASYAAAPDIDGALVGGASLDAGAFATIVRAVAASG